MLNPKPLGITVNGETGRDAVAKTLRAAIDAALHLNPSLELRSAEVRANGPNITIGEAHLVPREADPN